MGCVIPPSIAKSQRGGVCAGAESGKGLYVDDTVCFVQVGDENGVIATTTVGLGSQSVGVGVSSMTTNAEKLDDLGGVSVTGGGSGGYDIWPVGVGGDVGVSTDGKVWTGSVGASVGKAPNGEAHVGVSVTRILWRAPVQPQFDWNRRW